MKRAHFVETENARLFRSHVQVAENRGALEGGLMSVTGRPGEGKSCTVLNWAAANCAVMLTGQVDWTPRRMLEEMAHKLSIETTRGFERRVEEVIAKEGIPIVVDEAGFALVNSAVCLEKLRSITDKSYSLLILVFMDHDLTRLERHKQLSSRIATRCEFKKSSVADVVQACAQLCEVPVAPELAALIHAETDGRMRLVMNVISRLEAVASARPEAQRAAPMQLSDIRGMGLFNDFKSTVRASLGRRSGGNKA